MKYKLDVAEFREKLKRTFKDHKTLNIDKNTRTFSIWVFIRVFIATIIKIIVLWLNLLGLLLFFCLNNNNCFSRNLETVQNLHIIKYEWLKKYLEYLLPICFLKLERNKVIINMNRLVV